jgi:hypothetical protein
MANYPDPSHLGFRHKDRSDHEGGGYCASKSNGRIKGWDDLIDQHANALVLLVDAAVADGGGWGLTRPILFEAHHICELSMKRLLAQHQQSSRSHKLDSLWKQVVPLLPRRVSKGDKAWLDAFVAEMAELTIDGQDGRFPDATTDISKKWCCLNVPELQLCVGTFLLITRGGGRRIAVA